MTPFRPIKIIIRGSSDQSKSSDRFKNGHVHFLEAPPTPWVRTWFTEPLVLHCGPKKKRTDKMGMWALLLCAHTIFLATATPLAEYDSKLTQDLLAKWGLKPYLGKEVYFLSWNWFVNPPTKIVFMSSYCMDSKFASCSSQLWVTMAKHLKCW